MIIFLIFSRGVIDVRLLCETTTLNLLSNIQDTKYEKHRQDPLSPNSRAFFPVVPHVI